MIGRCESVFLPLIGQNTEYGCMETLIQFISPEQNMGQAKCVPTNLKPDLGKAAGSTDEIEEISIGKFRTYVAIADTGQNSHAIKFSHSKFY